MFLFEEECCEVMGLDSDAPNPKHKEPFRGLE